MPPQEQVLPDADPSPVDGPQAVGGEDGRWNVLLWVLASIAVVVGVLLVTWWQLEGDPDRGTFGDMFGGANALFSGLAFAGVIVAIVLQSRELRLQRMELGETRKELRGQKLQLEAQNRSLRLQTFENTLFQLLRMQIEIVNSLALHTARRTPIATGRACFKVLYEHLEEGYKKAPVPLEAEGDRIHLGEVFEDTFHSFESSLGPYMRLLQSVLAFIAEAGSDDAVRYASIVRAPLSLYELLLVHYYCVSQRGASDLRPLVERYALLAGLNRASLLSPAHYDLLDPRAFAG